MRSVAVDLSRMDTSLLKERALTENVSSRGIRVATEHEWKPGDPVCWSSLRRTPSGAKRGLFIASRWRKVDLLSGSSFSRRWNNGQSHRSGKGLAFQRSA
jgi:hypothetical protein